ncbi:MAG: type II/IV secretion system protein [Candidatus Taylorbacteria bacterium]|nr:type II/IV secretion system protein [Candidatus Taylorbacteria bacterium]
MIQFDEEKQNKQIKDLHKKEEEELAQQLSGKYGVEYVDLTTVPIQTDALRIIEETKSRDAKIVAFHLVDKKVSVAVISPHIDKTIEVMKELEGKGLTPIVFMASTASLEKAWSAYKDLSFAVETKAGSLEVSNEDINNIIKEVHSLPDVMKLIQDVLALKKSYRVSRIVEIIIAGALATNASDIHVEPEESYIRLRYRLDGVLTDVLKFDTETYNLLLSRIKLLSGLKLNIKKDSQDGRFSVKLNDTDMEIRTSILPGAYNESIVLRVLNPKSISVPIEELGIQPKLLKILEREMARPNGMILTTGPTGSGKTTTLYAFLKKVHNPGIKIITIEDPIEYHLPGIVQTQVNDKGYTFLDGLRAALRQDPDVIMVGEIRDGETAAIAINSAQTGHLVFSTLHTNNAAGTFPRLIDLGINSKVISSAINIALAQRLLRKLCPACKKQVPIDEKRKTFVDSILASITDKQDVPNTTVMWTAVGCDKCNNTGYKGRIGIYEAILTDEAIEKIVNENPSEREIAAAAIPQGIYTMKQDGVIKTLQGITSLDELERVIDLE